MTFQPSIPQPGDLLSKSQLDLLNNMGALNAAFGIDHTPFSVATNSGYHKAIHMIPQEVPLAVTGIDQLFSQKFDDGYANDTMLYQLTGGNLLTQLTRNIAPKANDNGYTYLPGGFILQWGFINTPPTSSYQTLTFSTNNIKFTSNCYLILTQPYGSATPSSGAAATVEIRGSTVNNLSFQWAFITTSSSFTGFYWAALGN
jgi:hypothetical protein